MVTLGKISDVPAMMELWIRCFGDSIDYVENFMKRLFPRGNAFLYKDGKGQLLSMLFIFDGEVKISTGTFSAPYVYAACTHPDFRREGLMVKLLENAENFARGNGSQFLSIRPANMHLFDYYAKFGFKDFFESKRIALSRFELESFATGTPKNFNPTWKEIKTLRDSVLRKGDCFIWDESWIEFAFGEAHFSNGGSVFAGNESLAAYALYFVENDTAVVKEICCEGNFSPQIARLLLEKTNASNFVFFVPTNFSFSAGTVTKEKIGMLKPLNENAENLLCKISSAYMGLALDD